MNIDFYLKSFRSLIESWKSSHLAINYPKSLSSITTTGQSLCDLLAPFVSFPILEHKVAELTHKVYLVSQFLLKEAPAQTMNSLCEEGRGAARAKTQEVT